METKKSPAEPTKKNYNTLINTLQLGLIIAALIIALYSTNTTQKAVDSTSTAYQNYIDTNCLCQDRTPTTNFVPLPHATTNHS